MRFDDFVNALETAGWRGTYDAQHTNIKRLWEQIFPVVAQLEQELRDTEGAFMNHLEIYGRS